MPEAREAGAASSAEAVAASHGGESGLPFVVLDVAQPLPETVLAAQELIEALPVPVFFKDREGSYLGVNKAWEEFFGIPRENFLGKEVQDLYPQNPEVVHKHHAMDDALWRHPGRQSYEITVAAKDGRMRDTIYYKATLPGEDGGVAGLIGTIVDITERKQADSALRESEARFRLTFELAGSGIAHVSLDGRFLRVNRSLCAILGYSDKELVGRTVKELSHPEDRDSTDAGRARVRSGELESTRFQKRYLRKDGATVWVDLTVALVRDAEGQTAVRDRGVRRRHRAQARRVGAARERGALSQPDRGVLRLVLGAGRGASLHPALARHRGQHRRAGRGVHRQTPLGLRRDRHVRGRLGRAQSRARGARAVPGPRVRALRRARPPALHRYQRQADIRRQRPLQGLPRRRARHHRAQAGGGGAAPGARRARALQRRARAVRLRRLARPAGAAAHGVELHAAAPCGATATASTATRRSSWPTSSTAPRA